MPKARIKTKTRSTKPRPERWQEQHRALCHLLEEEIHGLVHYLRSLHQLAIFLIIVSAGGLIFAFRALFENGQHAVTGFITIIVTCVAVAISSLLALRPWVLPRFLLPMDIHQLRYDEMMHVVSSPREFIHLLKHHIQQLTDTYLLRKLGHLRRSIAFLVFGVAVSIVLSIALP